MFDEFIHERFFTKETTLFHTFAAGFSSVLHDAVYNQLLSANKFNKQSGMSKKTSKRSPIKRIDKFVETSIYSGTQQFNYSRGTWPTCRGVQSRRDDRQNEKLGMCVCCETTSRISDFIHPSLFVDKNLDPSTHLGR